MSVADELVKMAGWRDAGVLTEAEFQMQKSILLGTPVRDIAPPSTQHLPPPPSALPPTSGTSF